MIFYVYMSPDVVEDAIDGGSYALDSFIGILQGFLQNCFIAEFEDDRIQRMFYRNFSQLPQSHAKKKIENLFGMLKKRRHFIACLVPNYLGEYDDFSCVIKQAESALLDLLLIAKKEIFTSSPPKIETTTLDNYNQSNFASSRSTLAQNGKTLKSDELGQDELLDNIFKKALIYAARIEICDRIFGRNFADNFGYSFSTMFKWLEKNVVHPIRLEKVVIHCEKLSENPKQCTLEHMKTELAMVKKGKFENLRIEIKFYQKEPPEKCDPLPHDRFLVTDQVAFNIGRGMDFLSKYTKKNRDISINYANPIEIAALIGAYRRYTPVEPVVL